MTGITPWLSQPGVQAYQGINPFQQTQQNPFAAASSTGIPGMTGISAPLLTGSTGTDLFSGNLSALPLPNPTSISAMSMMGTPPISGSTLQVMEGINSLMGSVTLQLGGFVQTLLQSYATRKQAETAKEKTQETSGTSSTDVKTAATTSTTAGTMGSGTMA